VVCDLRCAPDREALLALIRDRADIVIQNLRPGQTEALGLDGVRPVPRSAPRSLGEHTMRLFPDKDHPP